MSLTHGISQTCQLSHTVLETPALAPCSLTHAVQRGGCGLSRASHAKGIGPRKRRQCSPAAAGMPVLREPSSRSYYPCWLFPCHTTRCVVAIWLDALLTSPLLGNSPNSRRLGGVSSQGAKHVASVGVLSNARAPKLSRLNAWKTVQQ